MGSQKTGDPSSRQAPHPPCHVLCQLCQPRHPAQPAEHAERRARDLSLPTPAPLCGLWWSLLRDLGWRWHPRPAGSSQWQPGWIKADPGATCFSWRGFGVGREAGAVPGLSGAVWDEVFPLWGFAVLLCITASRVYPVPHSSLSGFVTGPQLATGCPSSLCQPWGGVGCVPGDVGAPSLLGPARTHRCVGLPHRFPRRGWRWHWVMLMAWVATVPQDGNTWKVPGGWDSRAHPQAGGQTGGSSPSLQPQTLFWTTREPWEWGMSLE